MTAARDGFPIGAAVTLEQLDLDPHPVLARLRASEPVSWLPALQGWLVTRHDLATTVMRHPSTFTVDDPRFSTAQVVGPSMLSLDGTEHARHRAPFAPPFRPSAVKERFAQAAAAEAHRLIDGLAAGGATHAELRRAFAGPLAASIMARALGLGQDEVQSMLAWYDGIVTAVTEITAGQEIPAAGREAFAALRARLQEVIAGDPGASLLGATAAHSDLTHDQIASNAGILLFGGIETTEGMITNALLYLLENPSQPAPHAPAELDAVIDESLRLEPAAAVVDRYATTEATLGSARIAEGELVRVSIAAANRDPAIFEDPDRYNPGRPRARRHLAFAQGPHVCLGIHLARLEARAGLTALTERLPNLALDPDHPPRVNGLVFRKPATLHARWDKA